MQITTVAKDLCGVFKQSARIEVVSIVGGMAEQKQVRVHESIHESIRMIYFGEPFVFYHYCNCSGDNCAGIDQFT
jgi:hypothetical protein